MHLNPDYRQHASKTGELDESLSLNHKYVRDFVVAHKKARKNAEGPLWDFTVGSLRQSFLEMPTPTGPVSVPAGTNWNFQGWFRDSNPGGTANLTNGLTIQF